MLMRPPIPDSKKPPPVASPARANASRVSMFQYWVMYARVMLWTTSWADAQTPSTSSSATPVPSDITSIGAGTFPQMAPPTLVYDARIIAGNPMKRISEITSPRSNRPENMIWIPVHTTRMIANATKIGAP